MNHLLYMDDIKLNAATETQSKGLRRISEPYISDNKLEFGMIKCKVLHKNNGQWMEQTKRKTLNNETLVNMNETRLSTFLKHQHWPHRNENKTEF